MNSIAVVAYCCKCNADLVFRNNYTDEPNGIYWYPAPHGIPIAIALEMEGLEKVCAACNHKNKIIMKTGTNPFELKIV